MADCTKPLSENAKKILLGHQKNKNKNASEGKRKGKGKGGNNQRQGPQATTVVLGEVPAADKS